MHDGKEINVEITGNSTNPCILISVNPNSLPEKEAEEKKMGCRSKFRKKDNRCVISKIQSGSI